MAKKSLAFVSDSDSVSASASASVLSLIRPPLTMYVAFLRAVACDEHLRCLARDGKAAAGGVGFDVAGSEEAQADDPETVVCNMQAAMWESSILICSSVVPNLAATSLYFEGGKFI
jgi:hypothetical protein